VHVGIKTMSGVVLALFIIVDIIITIINYDNGDVVILSITGTS